jgi:NADH-quinone oxidoreductase subunit L
VNAPVHEIDSATEFGLAALTTAVGLAGIALATLLYHWRRDLVPGIVAAIRPLYVLVRDKYRIDELYDFAIVRPLGAISRGLLARGIDQGLIDGIGVNGTARVVRASADGALKYLQTGLAQSYIFAMLLGGVLLVAWLVRGT